MTAQSRTTKKNIIGTRVKQARQRLSLRLSQVQLSNYLRGIGIDVCRTMVSRIESGERYVADYELIALAKCLNVSTAWLLGETTSYNKTRYTRR